MCVVGAAASWTVDAADGVIVRVDTACEAMAPDACLGAYGFRIAETGAYVARPVSGRTRAKWAGRRESAFRAGASRARRPRQIRRGVSASWADPRNARNRYCEPEREDSPS